MMPVHSYMDPNSCDQVHYPQYYHPGFQAVPSHLMVDPSKPPVLFECPPYGSNYGCSFPCHTYYNNSIPGYHNLRACPHIQPVPQHHCCGNHPPFPEAYPIHHGLPPYYPREQPRYEYRKMWPQEYHCGGCPNQKSNDKNDKVVKIEEAYSEPENESKNESVVPSQLKNYQYPIVWFPPEYLKNKENRNPSETNIAYVNDEKPDARPPENLKAFKQDPGFWNGWFSFDENKMQDDDGKRYEGWQNKHKDDVRQFPFPVFWMPNQSTQVKDREGKEITAAPRFSDEPSSDPKSATINLRTDDGPKDTLTDDLNSGSGSRDGSEMVGRIPTQKNIPVKEIQSTKEDDIFEEAERKVGSATMEKRKNAEVDKPSRITTRRQFSSPPKMSKLPPVCLRVDPFPRKKLAVVVQGLLVLQALKDNHKTFWRTFPSGSVASSGRQTKIIKVEEMKPGENKDEKTVDTDIKSSVNYEGKISMGSVLKNTGKDGRECQVKDDRAQSAGVLKLENMTKANKIRHSAESADGVLKQGRKLFSDIEAAMVIQSAYRGFEVRKWEPLKKLKQMTVVREQVTDIRNRICVLESSVDHQKVERQRVVLGEMIMNLFLKLDTIQGLHPSLRDIRKSLARELTTLQEKLDSLIKNHEKLTNDGPCSIVEMQEDQNGETGIGEDSTGTCYQSSYVVENQGQVCQTTDTPSSIGEVFGREDVQSQIDTDLPAVRKVQMKAAEDTLASGSIDGANSGQLDSKLAAGET
ncbi:BAG family molecular chaperone regulator 6 [Tripterygium wilfordii]|uniref:BAG family molecular chaperone regulator 6 n=1 Tax=Tripterygium wilfordii TaxID=458696 RepID=A0A7J7CGB6_TRIWF|nr:BAG family molecular chaperone regulator 6 [Tripterygium wilfordii]